MDLPEFEQRYRNSIEQILSDLQFITLRLTELERKVLTIGRTVQDVSSLVEDFIESQKQ